MAIPTDRKVKQLTYNGVNIPLGDNNLVTENIKAGVPILGITGTYAPVIQALTATQNGTYTAPSGVDGYSPVTVNVSGSSTPIGDSVAGSLLFWFDGIENAGKGVSHDPSATTWADLSGNGRDGAVTDGVWYNDHLHFNGSTSWVNCGELNPAMFTLEAVVSFDVIDTSRDDRNFVAGNEQSSGIGVCQNYGKNAAEIKLYGGSSWQILDTGVIASANTPYVLTFMFDGVTLKLFEDGILKSQRSVRGAVGIPSSGTPFAVGMNPDSSGFEDYSLLTGSVYSIRLWNAGLSDSVIAGLYQEIVDRFNL